MSPIVRPLPSPTSARSCCRCRGERRGEGAAGGEAERGGCARWVSLVAARGKRRPPRARAVDGDAAIVGLPCDRPALWSTGGGGPRPRAAPRRWRAAPGAGDRSMEVRDGGGARRPSLVAAWLPGELRWNMAGARQRLPPPRHFEGGCDAASTGGAATISLPAGGSNHGDDRGGDGSDDEGDDGELAGRAMAAMRRGRQARLLVADPRVLRGRPSASGRQAGEVSLGGSSTVLNTLLPPLLGEVAVPRPQGAGRWVFASSGPQRRGHGRRPQRSWHSAAQPTRMRRRPAWVPASVRPSAGPVRDEHLRGCGVAK